MAAMGFKKNVGLFGHKIELTDHIHLHHYTYQLKQASFIRELTVFM